MPSLTALPDASRFSSPGSRPGSLLPIIGASVAIALLMSTQYLIQPFVWRNWPWDEVLIGWLEVACNRIVIAVCIGAALFAVGRLQLAGLHRRTAGLAVGILAGSTAGELVLLASDAPGAARDAAAVLSQVARWSVVAASVAAIWYLWRSATESTTAAQALALRRVQLERQATEARLEVLRGQIEPHFLFNTLATVRRLQQVNPAEGARLLAHFVAYLRSAQSSPQGDDAGTLGAEVDLARAYLGVVEQRMNGRLTVRFEVADDLRAQPFPPLTIATLVENAVKHGIAPTPDGGTITVSARRCADILEAQVSDTGAGFSGKSGSGIGLANIRARLRTLYGTEASLSLHNNSPAGFRAILRVPLGPAPAMSGSR